MFEAKDGNTGRATSCTRWTTARRCSKRRALNQDQMIAALEEPNTARPVNAGDSTQSAEMRHAGRQAPMGKGSHRRGSWTTAHHPARSAELQRELRVGVDVIPWSLYSRRPQRPDTAQPLRSPPTPARPVSRSSWDGLSMIQPGPVLWVSPSFSKFPWESLTGPCFRTGATVAHETGIRPPSRKRPELSRSAKLSPQEPLRRIVQPSGIRI